MSQVLGGGDTSLYTDAPVTFYVTPSDDRTGDTIRAYLVDDDNNREEWGSGVAGTNQTEVGIEDKWTNLSTITDVKNLTLQWRADDGSNEETLTEVDVEFTKPAHER